MEKVKILIISSAFYPEISPRSFRATELAKEFHRQGHSVTVITRRRDYDYSYFLDQYPIELKMWKKSIFKQVPESTIKLFSLFARVVNRLLQMLIEYPAIEEMFQVHKKLKREKGYNLAISFAVPYPVHWGVAWARSVKNPISKVWVADCGDPYMGDVIDSFKKLFYFEYLEKWFCKKADYISIPIQTAIKAYYPQFHHKIKIIPQGFSFDLNEKKKNYTKNNIQSFAYAGSFLKGSRDPSKLLMFLKKLDIPFKFYIYTNNIDFLDEHRKDLNERLIISNYVPRDQLLENLSKMDFLINFDNNTKLNSPSKLIDYIIVNRPVLNITNEFDSSELLEFLHGDYSKQMELPDPEKFHITRVSKQFLELIRG